MLDEIKQRKTPCALALGTFDGVHLGHMAVIRETARRAEEKNGAGVLTFGKSPMGESLLMLKSDKEELLRAKGMGFVITLDFPEVKDIDAEGFAREILFGRLMAKSVVCGEDFRFGRGAAGNTELLKKLSAEYGARVYVIPKMTMNGEKISSTRIRAAIRAGDIALANAMLGRPFSYTLEIIHGRHLGTGLGTPTINQALPEDFTLPPFGVYASLVTVDGQEHLGVTNIGVKPTVGSDRVLSETWMPGYSGDLYGRSLKTELYEFIRPEKKFSSLSELRLEIEKNAVQAENIINSLYKRG